MSEEYVKATPVSRAHQDQSQRCLHIEHSGQEPAAITTAESSTFAGSLLSDLSVLGRANAPMRQAAMRSMQRIHGNRALQRAVSTGSFTAVQRSPDEDEEGAWPRWLNSVPGALRMLAMHMGNTSAPASTPPHANPALPALEDGRLFPGLSDLEMDTAFRQANAPTGFELPGQNPDVVAPGQPAGGAHIGLQGDPAELVVPEGEPRTGMRQTTVGENPNAIAYHENMEFRNLGDPVLDADGNPVMRPDGSPQVILLPIKEQRSATTPPTLTHPQGATPKLTPPSR